MGRFSVSLFPSHLSIFIHVTLLFASRSPSRIMGNFVRSFARHRLQIINIPDRCRSTFLYFAFPRSLSIHSRPLDRWSTNRSPPERTNMQINMRCTLFPWNWIIAFFPLDSRETNGFSGKGGRTRRMEIERARSAERFRMGCKRGNGDKLATLCAPPRGRIIRLPGDFVIQIGPASTSWEKPLFNAETAPPTLQEEQESLPFTPANPERPVLALLPASLEKPPRKKLYRVSLDSR